MNKKKLFSSILAGVLAVSSVIGFGSCGPTHAIQQSSVTAYDGSAVTIEFDHAMGQALQNILNRAIKRFNEDYPKITVKAGSEACWLFVQLKKENRVDDYVSYQVADGWTALGGNGVYYRDVAKTQEDVAYTVLKDNQITIKDTVTEEKASLITSKPKLTVYAYAVQSDNVATAAEAWTIMQANLQE